jgi:hypothetical protein
MPPPSRLKAFPIPVRRLKRSCKLGQFNLEPPPPVCSLIPGKNIQDQQSPVNDLEFAQFFDNTDLRTGKFIVLKSGAWLLSSDRPREARYLAAPQLVVAAFRFRRGSGRLQDYLAPRLPSAQAFVNSSREDLRTRVRWAPGASRDGTLL